MQIARREAAAGVFSANSLAHDGKNRLRKLSFDASYSPAAYRARTSICSARRPISSRNTLSTSMPAT